MKRDEGIICNPLDLSLNSRSNTDSIHVPCFVHDDFAEAMNIALGLINDSTLTAFCTYPGNIFFELDENENSIVENAIHVYSSGMIQCLMLIDTKKYSYYGRLLIAMYELYHIYLAINGISTDNDFGHFLMVNDQRYYMWLSKILNCGSDAKYLAYIGTEGTSIYAIAGTDIKYRVVEMRESMVY